MTLILTCLTREYVVQVSDRRLTLLRGPSRGEIAEFEQTKTVVYKWGAVIGYTGLADIGPEARTDVWIVEEVRRTQSITAMHDALAIGAAAELEGLASTVPSAHRRHAFGIGGWRSEPIDG